MPMTIDSVVRWWSMERPDQAALWESGDAVTYAELHDWVGRVAGSTGRARRRGG